MRRLKHTCNTIWILWLFRERERKSQRGKHKRLSFIINGALMMKYIRNAVAKNVYSCLCIQNKLRERKREHRAECCLQFQERYIVVQLEKMCHCLCRMDALFCASIYWLSMCVCAVHWQCASYVFVVGPCLRSLLFPKMRCMWIHTYVLSIDNMNGLAMHITQLNSVVCTLCMFHQSESNEKRHTKPETFVLVFVYSTRCSTMQLNLCVYIETKHTRLSLLTYTT